MNTAKAIPFGLGALALAALLSAGCFKDEEPRSSAVTLPEVVHKALVNPSIKPGDTVASVNGTAITRRDYDLWVALRSRVFCLDRKLDPTKSNEKLEKYNSRTRMIALYDLIRRELVRQECARTSLEIPDASLAASKSQFMKGIRRAGEDYGKFLASLPEDERDTLSKMITSDAQCEYMLRRVATNDFLNVSDTEVSNRVALVVKGREDVKRLNDEARRKAAEAKAAILAGESFYSVTTNRAEIFKEEGGEWDVVELGELDDDTDLFRFLATANAGDISDPIDLDDGIGIVGVLAKEMGEVPEGVTPSLQYTLVRCMFNAYEDIDEPEDPAKMRKLILEEKRKAAQEAMMSTLLKDAKIELPYGNDLFGRPKKKGKGRKKK